MAKIISDWLICGRSLRSLAKEYKVTPERIRQVAYKGLRIIRNRGNV